MLPHRPSRRAGVQFRRVIDAITASRAPVVGHNALLDFIHTTSKFVCEPPPNVAEWAVQLRGAFPTVFDTKVVCALPELAGIFGGGTSLGQVHDVATSRAATAWVELPPPPATPADAGVADAASAAVAGTKRSRPEDFPSVAAAAAADAPDAASAPAGATPTPAAATPQAAAGGITRPNRGLGGSARPPRAERLPFSIDVASVVDIRLADGFGFSDAGAAAAPSPPAASSSAVDAAKAAGLTPASSDAAAAAAEGAAHDAGADAFMTGVAFLRMAALLAAGVKHSCVAAATSAGAARAAAGRPAQEATRAPPPPLALHRVAASEVAALLLRASESIPPPPSESDAAAVPRAAGEAALARAADSLFLMRIAAPDHRILRLRDGACLSGGGRGGALAFVNSCRHLTSSPPPPPAPSPCPPPPLRHCCSAGPGDRRPPPCRGARARRRRGQLAHHRPPSRARAGLGARPRLRPVARRRRGDAAAGRGRRARIGEPKPHRQVRRRGGTLPACLLAPRSAPPLRRRWKHISFVDDNSAFVLLPSHVHAQELLAAASGVRASVDGAAADDDDMAEDSAAGGGGGGMNMLGLPGVDHVMRALPAAEVLEQAQAPEAPQQQQQQGIWAGLPDDLAALIPQPPRLADFRWESYAQYLARRADIYGAGACVPCPPARNAVLIPALTLHGPAASMSECNHEVIEPFRPAPLLASASAQPVAADNAGRSGAASRWPTPPLCVVS